MILAVAAAQFLVTGGPAWADDTHHGVASTAPSGIAIFMRALTAIAAAVAAGLALAGPGTDTAARPDRTLPTASAIAAALASLATIEVDPSSSATLAVTLALAAIALPWLRWRSPVAYAAAIAAVLLPAVQATAGEPGARRPAGVVFTVGAMLWLAFTAIVASRAADRRPEALRRLAPWAAVVVAVTVATALVRGWNDGVRPDGTLWWSTFGWLTALEVVLLAAAATLGFVAVLGKRRIVGPVRSTAALVAGALVTASALAALPIPPAPATPAVALLRSLDLAGDRLPVLVVPQRPGWNLVHVGSDEAAAGLDPQRLTPAGKRPGTTGSWALVHLPAGRSRLWIGHRGATGWLHVDTGQSTVDAQQFAGADGPECASAGLGAVLAGSPRPLESCPAQQLSPGGAEALRAMVRYVAGRGVPAISVAGDESPRGRQAQALVRQAAAELGVPVVDSGRHPLFVVSGWAAAEATLRGVSTGELPAEGAYLAPWLLTGPLLAIKTGPLLALRFDTRSESAGRYLAALAERFPGEPPTAVGYTSWLRDEAGLTEPLRLYAASQVFAPGSGAHGHQVAAAWVPNGTVVAVTGPLATTSA